MTHKDIYTKFMIEYDKANVTSSYPSLTEYEVATVLDKAYHALIAQKVTGNNIRRVALEGDLKSISDIYPLVKKYNTPLMTQIPDSNVMYETLPQDLLYYVSGKLTRTINSKYNVFYTVEIYGTSPQDDPFGPMHDQELTLQDIRSAISRLQSSEDRDSALENTPSEDVATHIGDYFTVNYKTAVWKFVCHRVDTVGNNVTVDAPMDHIPNRPVPVKLVNHDIADRFVISASNLPWIKTPVCYMEDDKIFVVYDSINVPDSTFEITYIKYPNKFVKDIDAISRKYSNRIQQDQSLTITFFDCKITTTTGTGVSETSTEATYTQAMEDDYNFECSDTVAEELISLAIVFALENIESSRLNSKLNTRGLEG